MSHPTSNHVDFQADIIGSMPSPNFNALETQRRLQRTQQQYSQTQEQLSSLIRARSTTPHMSPVELDCKDKQITDMQAMIHHLEQQIRAMKATISQQRATIRTQSKTIENTRPNRVEVTPFRAPNTFQHYGSAPPLNGPLPAFNLSQPKAPPPTEPKSLRSMYGQGPIDRPPTAYGQQATDVFEDNRFSATPLQHLNPTVYPRADDYGSPAPVRKFEQTQAYHQQKTSGSPGGFKLDSFGNGDNSSNIFRSSKPGSFQPAVGHERNLAPRTPQQPKSTSPQTPSQYQAAQQQQSKGTNDSSDKLRNGEAAAAFQKVFEMSLRYAYSHANTPSNSGDACMPDAVKERLLAAATITTAHPIMCSPNTRYFLVSKVITQWIIKNILHQSAFRGLDLEIDNNIETAKGQLYQSTPAPVRYLLLSSIANEVRKLKMNAAFPDHVRSLSHQRGNELWAIVKPLMHAKTACDWDDIFFLMQEAHKLAELMFTGTDEYRCDFIVAGAKLEWEKVVNVDPNFPVNSVQELAARGATVKLSVSPHVTGRTNSSNGVSETIAIQKAAVLVRLGMNGR